MIDYNHWFIHGEKRLTTFNNLAGPGYYNMCTWIQKGWKKINQQTIIDSFKCCGITSNKLNDYSKHLKAVLQNDLNPLDTIVEKKSNYDFQDVCLFGDLSDDDEDDDPDDDYE